ncbi:class I SAM-dependent methyltransferase [Candidatus Pacearchaeota archaeon]|nr:class I SAM-dependent methyltransferase [Candidatus Pacearchaeota archaeon]
MNRIKYLDFMKWKNSIKKTDSFLDIGCWSGATVLELNEKCDAYGADFNKETLKLAPKKIKDKLVYCDITKNKPFNKKFDWILLSEVIEHIPEEKKAIKNISKSLKMGGKLILTTPKSVPFFEFWDPAWVRWKFGGKERHYHFTLNELESLLKANELKIKEYSTYGPLRWVFARWINVFLKFVLKSKKIISFGQGDGFCEWMILAEKIK